MLLCHTPKVLIGGLMPHAAYGCMNLREPLEVFYWVNEFENIGVGMSVERYKP